MCILESVENLLPSFDLWALAGKLVAGCRLLVVCDLSFEWRGVLVVVCPPSPNGLRWENWLQVAGCWLCVI